MQRKKLNKSVETEVLTSSKRKCSLCVGVSGDYGEKMGQIAHLDQNNSNNNFDNLCWLCLPHHSQYDTKTSQHKNYTIDEVKKYRNRLYYNLNINDYDNLGLIENSIVKPYSVQFNGLNSLLIMESLNLDVKSGIILETEFRIQSKFYAGVVFSLRNSSTNEMLYMYRFSAEHPERSNELSLFYRKENFTHIVSIVDEVTSWTQLIFQINSKSMTISLNKKETKLLNQFKDMSFDILEIAGSFSVGMSYLESYFNHLRVFSGGEIISNMEFCYGHEYIYKTNVGTYKFYGGMRFVKMIKDAIK